MKSYKVILYLPIVMFSCSSLLSMEHAEKKSFWESKIWGGAKVCAGLGLGGIGLYGAYKTVGSVYGTIIKSDSRYLDNVFESPIPYKLVKSAGKIAHNIPNFVAIWNGYKCIQNGLNHFSEKNDVDSMGDNEDVESQKQSFSSTAWKKLTDLETIGSGIKKSFIKDPFTPSILALLALSDRKVLKDYSYIAFLSGATWLGFALRNSFFSEKFNDSNNGFELLVKHPMNGAVSYCVLTAGYAAWAVQQTKGRETHYD